LVVDSREPSYFAEKLATKWPRVTVEALKYGDFELRCVDGYTINLERKTISDFAGSWNSDKLHRQIADMMANTNHPCLIFEHDVADYHHMIDIVRVLQHVETLSFNLNVIRTGSRRHTIKVLIDLIRNLEVGKIQTLKVQPEIQRLESKYQQMICSIPGISPTKAKAITKRYPSMLDLVLKVGNTWDYDEWASMKKKKPTKVAWRKSRWYSPIDGIGEKLGARIERLLMWGEWD